MIENWPVKQEIIIIYNEIRTIVYSLKNIRNIKLDKRNRAKGATLSNASDYQTNRLHRTHNPNPSPLAH